MIWKLTQRNINVYVRNRMSVFFSFLSVIIIIGLYALFLGKLQEDNIKDILNRFQMPTNGARFLVDSWIMSGLLAVNAVTVALGALGTMVFDIENKRFNDFIVAPVSRTAVVLSHLLSSCIISFMFNMIAFIVGELYILSGGGEFLSPLKMLEVVGLIALSAITASSIMFLIASFIKSASAFGTLSTLVGTLIGFVTGVYVPVGVLPEAVQKAVIFVPFTHSAALFRQVFCERPLDVVFSSVPAQAVDEFSNVYGINVLWGGERLDATLMLGVLAGTAVVFLVLSALKLRSYKQA